MKFYKVLESLNNDFESELYHSVSIESTLIKIVIVVFMQMSMERWYRWCEKHYFKIKTRTMLEINK